MKEHVKEQPRLGEAEEVLKQGQVARAGDGEKFRDPLDQSQKDG